MKPIDFRNGNFAALRGRLTEKREAVWLDWSAYEIRHGIAGATTRAVCLWAGRDLLQFRPVAPSSSKWASSNSLRPRLRPPLQIANPKSQI